MKKRWIVIAAIAAILMIFASRYAIIEREDTLPEDLRAALRQMSGIALAEEQPPQQPAPPRVQPTEPVIVQVIEPTPVPTPVPTPTPEPTPTPAPTPEPRLEKGDRGDEVKAVQQRLKDLGFLTGNADGIYGDKTEQAVKDFRQHIHDLEQERLAAEQARLEEEQRKLEEELAQQQAEGLQETDEPENTDEPTAAPSEPVNTDEPTAAPSEEPDQEPDAEPQQEPSEAVLAVIEGKVDELTYQLLAEGGFDEYQEKLTLGARGAEVRRLQMKLKALGYMTGNADGIFGQKTLSAVKAFQQRNKLTQDGIAGEKTQRKLYSADALRYVAPAANLTKEQMIYTGKPYYLKVSTADQRVYAYAWSDADGAYSRLVRTMVCSTGLADSPTPKGTYSSETTPRVRWGYFPKFDVWAQYLYRIKGPYLFHSVLYDEADESTVRWGSVNKLGTPASHGCVRLSVEDAKWIYNNCPAGTTVTVY